MLVKSLLVLGGLATLGYSFILPRGLSNGVYQVYYNEAGEEVYELVAANVEPASPTLEQTKRDGEIVSRWNSKQTWCGCAFPMNAGDTNIANQNLAAYAANNAAPLAPNNAALAVQNSAVAFICNKSNTSKLTVPRNLVSLNAPDISYNCGNFIAGTSRIMGVEAADYGYMNYISARDVCPSAEASKQSTCPGAAGGKRRVRGAGNV